MAITIVIPKQEMYDEKTKEFFNLDDDVTLTMEHSLVSISKWESKWHKIYLDPNKEVTEAEAMDYLRCMTINRNIEPWIFSAIPRDELKRINDYINDPMTATTFRQTVGNNKPRRKTELQSSELLYYYMFKLGIPKECEKWHINRLMTLMQIYAIKEQSNDPNNKVSRADTLARYKEINQRNKAKFHTRG